jgi:SAM-dependent methyltransferase
MWQNRSLEREQLDQLDLAGAELEKSLYQLSQVNHWLGAYRAIISGLEKLKEAGSFEPFRSQALKVVDLGCGGGDLLRQVRDWGVANGFQLELTGIDGNPHVLQYAAAQSSDYPEIKFHCQDLLKNPALSESFDLVLSSHFLYHFSDAELRDILRNLQLQTRIAIISTDLQRHWLPFRLFQLLNLFLPTTAMIQQDGLLAIRRSFQRRELEHILAAAKAPAYRLRWFWAFRFQLIIYSQAYA